MASLATYAFQSHLLGNTREVWVLPPSGAQREERPVLCVMLDGEYYTQRMAAPRIIQQLQEDGDLPPLVCLFVSHLDSGTRWKECPCNARFADALCNELLPWAVTEFEVDSAGEHLIGGLSFTGLAAAYTGLRSAGRFGRVLCQSASFWWSDQWLIDQYARSQRLPIRFYISCGDRECAVNVEHAPGVVQGKSQLEVNREMYEVLRDRKYPVRFEQFNGGHDCEAWERDLPNGLRFLLASQERHSELGTQT